LIKLLLGGRIQQTLIKTLVGQNSRFKGLVPHPPMGGLKQVDIYFKNFNFNKMKTEKMSFKNIKDVLSRDEMRVIMAGSGGGGTTCSVTCSSTSESKSITNCDRATVELECGNVTNATCSCW